MIVLWCGFVGLFVLRLIKRHGWEYVPLVLLAFGAWWCFGNQVPAGFGDGVLLTAIAGVQMVTRKDVITAREM